MTTHALLFCLRPHPETARRLSDWSMALFASEGLRSRASRAERLHVTLHHLGWFDDQTPEGRGEMADVLEASIRVGERFTSSPPRVDFDQLLSFTHKLRNCPMVLSGGAVLDEVRTMRASVSSCRPSGCASIRTSRRT